MFVTHTRSATRHLCMYVRCLVPCVSCSTTVCGQVCERVFSICSGVAPCAAACLRQSAPVSIDRHAVAQQHTPPATRSAPT